MAYFGNQEDAVAIAEIREDIKTASGTFRILHDGISQYLNNPDLDCVDLVQKYANSNVHDTPAEANAWLRNLFSQLFGHPV